METNPKKPNEDKKHEEYDEHVATDSFKVEMLCKARSSDIEAKDHPGQDHPDQIQGSYNANEKP